jgi:hypothetical protein
MRVSWEVCPRKVDFQEITVVGAMVKLEISYLKEINYAKVTRVQKIEQKLSIEIVRSTDSSPHGPIF